MKDQLQQHEYSSGVQRKIAEAVKRNNLPFVGGDVDGQIGKDHFLSHMPLSLYDADLTPEQRGKVNVLFPQALRGVLAVDNGDAKSAYLESIGGRDFENIPLAAKELANETVKGKTQSENVAIRVVFGATEQMSYRALGSFASALSYQDGIRKSGVAVPQLQIVFPRDFSGRMNELDSEKTKAEMDQFLTVTQAYQQEFFPELSGSVIYLEDKPMEESEAYKEALHISTQYLHETISDDVRERLLGKGNGAIEKQKIMYAAAHAYYHDTTAVDALKPAVSQQSEPIVPTVVISKGGYQEIEFYEIRHLIRDQLEDTVATVQFVDRFRVPPYYMARGGDVSLSEVLADPSRRLPTSETGKTVAKDLAYTEKVSAERGDLDIFLRGVAA